MADLRRLKGRRKAAALALSAMLFLPKFAFSQTAQGALSGNIQDPSGALVPSAKVSATELNSGAHYDTVSTSSGDYSFPSLKIGTYNITVTAAGFAPSEVKGVVVSVGTTSSLNIAL